MTNNNQHSDDHADGIVEDRKQAPPIYFNILFYGLIVWGVIFMAYFLLSGWSSQQEFDQKMTAHTAEHATQDSAPQPVAATAMIATEAGQSADASELFAANCAGCHGADGKGGFGTDLSGKYVYGKTPAAVKDTIINGRGVKMPAFGGRLSEPEIDALVAFSLQL